MLFKRLKQEGRIVDDDFTHYNTSRVVFTPKHMTREALYRGYLWIYDEIYSFKNILRRMPRDRRQWLAYLFFNFGYRKFGGLTSRIARLGYMNAIGRLARRLAYGIA